MSLFVVAVSAIACFALGYLIYGGFLKRQFRLSPTAQTPAHRLRDGLDYVPAKAPFLLGQHFSAIAAAGPIVGPILAGMWFGWLPALLWIVFGAIFLGAVHDFSAMVGSVRHDGHSIVELIHRYLGRKAHLVFLAFVWISLIYVITAFTDLTASSFVDPELGGGVATASVAYLGIAVAMGVALSRFKMPLGLATLIFVPCIGAVIWHGQRIPLIMPAAFGLEPKHLWSYGIFAYCLVASVLPLWLLLQPRGYLGGFFLYLTLAAGVIGLFLGGESVRYPAFLGWTSLKGLPLFPMLFVTVACGACSGFHGIVSSGTTSKQISREDDCRLVGYGGMLLEGLVAVIALSTVMMLAPGDALLSTQPDRIYANGLARFVGRVGIHHEIARSFALLAFATFIFDTLDVATRLGRYVFQELTGWRGAWGRIGATVLTLAIPAYCVSVTMHDATGAVVPGWRVFWTIFGTSNQLLAALTLLGLTVWLKRAGANWWISALPMAFMMTMTLWSLALIIAQWTERAWRQGFSVNPVDTVAVVLFALAGLILLEAAKAWRRPSI